MRLIDADNLIGLCNIMADKCDGIGEAIWNQFAETVRWCPTIDAEPVRHGHWIMLHKTHNVDEDNDYDWKCSECNHVDCHNINVEVPFCWNCGALMDEEQE